jgi:acyl-coenzyme A synthetase/AMP-(fatty) acid ligase
LSDLLHGTSLVGGLARLKGKSVIVAAGSQFATALALIELDGVARRITILPPDVDADHIPALVADAQADAVVGDHETRPSRVFDHLLRINCSIAITPCGTLPAPSYETEWVLLTSGTTGVPKMVVHSLRGLTASFAGKTLGDCVVWGTFYDIRRYGGLQVFLRSVLGGVSLVLSHPGETTADHLERLGRHGVTYLLGTPTHWRRALIAPAVRQISPRYVRLSGEIADQAVLDVLRATFPQATVSHAYASTEAGVAFEVSDGRAGFPVDYVEHGRDGVHLKVVDGSLRIRSSRTASRYLGPNVTPLCDPDGYVDTGDLVHRYCDRYRFAGRRGAIINVGGLKVHPEEIEAVLNRHPQVRMSLVRSRPSPITGSIVIADVLLKSDSSGTEFPQVENELLKFCRATLPPHKVPATISIVSSLDIAATGKLTRRRG